MKLGTFFLLFLSTHSFAASPEACLEAIKANCALDTAYRYSASRREVCKEELFDELKESPPNLLVEDMQRNRMSILEAAHAYGLDAHMLAGAILGKNIYNHSRYGYAFSANRDDWLNALGHGVKVIMTPLDALGGHGYDAGMTGVTMLNVDENFCAKQEHRAVLDASQAWARASSDSGSVYYMACFLKSMQEKYRAAGVDISQRPDIQASFVDDGLSYRGLKTKKPLSTLSGLYAVCHNNLTTLILTGRASPVIQTSPDFLLNTSTANHGGGTSNQPRALSHDAR